MALIVFRTRMAPDAPDGYGARAAEIYGYALKAPGFVAIKEFVADDGERLALVEFETEAQSRAWGRHAEHRRAQQEGRDLYYAEYSVQVCEVVRESRFQKS
jgi:heme-degrading monooxygenase HmoA